MARLKKRKDGRYMKTVNIGIGENGKPTRKSVYGRTVKELDENVLKTIEAAKINGDPKLSMTIAQWSNIWLETKRPLAYYTWKMYESMLRAHILPAIGEFRMSEVKIIHIQNLMDKIMIKGHFRTSVKVYVTLRQMFESAILNEIITENIMLFVKKPKCPKPKKRALKLREVQIIKNIPLTLKERAFVGILHRTGIRFCELMALNKSDIDFDTDTLTIDKDVYYMGNRPVIKLRPKSDASNRTLPIPDDLKIILEEYIATLEVDNDILFSHGNGIMTMTAFRGFWAKIRKKLSDGGITANDITPHIFRHNWLTELSHKGMDIKTLQILGGHESPAMLLEVYLHEAEDSVETARKMLNS